MKRVLFLFAFFLFATPVFSQELLMDTEDVYDPDVIQPKFNGGSFDKFNEYIQKSFSISTVTKPGKMVATFTIDIDGSVKNIRIVQFVESNAAAEFIRVLMLSPKWEAAKRNGKSFSMQVKFPLEFK